MTMIYFQYEFNKSVSALLRLLFTITDSQFSEVASEREPILGRRTVSETYNSVNS